MGREQRDTPTDSPEASPPSENPNLGLARAITRRTFTEKVGTMDRMTRVLGSQPKQRSQYEVEADEMVLELSSFALAGLIDNPETGTSVGDYVMSNKDAFIDNMFDQLPPDAVIKAWQGENPAFDQFTRDFTQQYLEGIYIGLVSNPQSEFSTVGLVEAAQAAKEFAAERNVDPEVVFTENELYEQFVREVDLPQRVAQESIDWTTLTINDSLEFSEVRLLARAHNVPLVVDNEDGTARLQETVYQEYPDFIRELEDELEARRKAALQVTREIIERFWGEDGIASLPDELRSQLLPDGEINTQAQPFM